METVKSEKKRKYRKWIRQPDGTYRKRKKPGPRKKHYKRKKKCDSKYIGKERPYHIITVNNGVMMKDLYSAVDYDTCKKRMVEISDKINRNVVFPVKYVSDKHEKYFRESDYKLVMIKRIQEGVDARPGKVKNEFGRYVDCVTDNDRWEFVEEMPYYVEESFWVYGFNPKRQRKDVTFITGNIIAADKDDKFFLKQVIVFKNKLLIDSLGGLNMIICKTHDDAVRLYNFIGDFVGKNKLKYVTMSGNLPVNAHSFLYWLDKMRKLTNWTRKKLMRNNTRE